MNQKLQTLLKHLRRPRNIAVALVITAIVIVATIARPRNASDQPETKDRYFRAERGDFNITIILDGNLDAIKRHELSYEGRGLYGLEVAELVEDQSHVEEGDVVVQFAREKYDEQVDKRLLQIEGDQKNLLVAQQDLQMTRVAGQNTIRFSTDRLRSGELALTKYEHEDAPRRRRKLTEAGNAAEQAVSDAASALSTARDALNSAKAQSGADLVTLEKQVSTREKAHEAAVANHEQALYELRTFKKYEHPDKLRTLQEALTKARMQLRQDIVEASGRETKARRTIQSIEANLEQAKEDLEQLREDIDLLSLKAPISGIVSLGASSSGRHWRDESRDIEVGVVVGARETVATIPDLSKFAVHVKLPEEFRSHARLGQTASLKSKAIPGLALSGTVTEISPVASRMLRWDPNSPKYYSTTISTDAADPRLMPGMTMTVEVLVERVTDVVHVPVEAVYNREGKKWCKIRRVTGLEEVEVKTGRSSNDHVEILEGIKPGDEVFLHRE